MALEDEVMRLFGGETIANLMTALKMPEDQPIEHGLVSRAIEQAQSKIEGFYFDQRKRVVEYDDVMNKQREIIYGKRKEILEQPQDTVSLFNRQIEALVQTRMGNGLSAQEVEAVGGEFSLMLPLDDASQQRLKQQVKKLNDAEEVIELLKGIVVKAYTERRQQVGEELMRQIERFAYLSSIDSLWMDHLDAMDDLREGIGLRGYGQRDPLIEYKAEAFDKFSQLMIQIDSEVVKRIFRVQVQRIPETTMPMEQAVAVKPEETLPSQPVVEEGAPAGDFAAALARVNQLPPSKPEPARAVAKIGRNDPCPCGAVNPDTGKAYKYKKCGMINAPYHKG